MFLRLGFNHDLLHLNMQREIVLDTMPLTVQYHSEIRSSGGSVCGMLHSTIQWNSLCK